MATTNATLTLSSGDLVGSNLSLSASTVLNKAGNNTGMDQAVGLSRKLTSSEDTYTLFKADEFTSNVAHKVYLKNIYPHANISTTTITTQKCPKNVPHYMNVNFVQRYSKTVLDYGDTTKNVTKIPKNHWNLQQNQPISIQKI